MVPRQYGLTRRPERPSVTQGSSGLSPFDHRRPAGRRRMLPTGCAILPMLVASCLNGRVSTLAELRELIARHLDQAALPAAPGKAPPPPPEPMPAVSQPAFAVVAQGTKRTML